MRRPRNVRLAARPAHPIALERAYTRDLIGVSRALVREVRKALGSGLDNVRLDAVDPTGVNFDRLAVRLGRLADSRAAELTARYGVRLASFSARQIAEVLEIDVTKDAPEVLKILARWRRENVALIQSIAERLHDDVRDVVTEAVQRGTRSDVLARELADRYSVSDSRAALIARDQIAKANAGIAQAHMAEAGVTKYAWSTSRDERVRPMHAALEGQIFDFDDPPITNDRGEHNNPGTDIQCRCTAIPVLDATPVPQQPSANPSTARRGYFSIAAGGTRSQYTESE